MLCLHPYQTNLCTKTLSHGFHGVFFDIIDDRQAGYVAHNRVTPCLENPEMSGILTAVREMSGISLKVREKILSDKVAKNCLLLVAYLRLYGYLIAKS